MKIDREAFVGISATLATSGSHAVAAQVVWQRTQSARDGAFVEAQLVADFGHRAALFAHSIHLAGQFVRGDAGLTLAFNVATGHADVLDLRFVACCGEQAADHAPRVRIPVASIEP